MATCSSSSVLGAWDVLRVLGVFRYLDVNEEEEELSELDLRCSTHTYVLKTEGVSIQIVVPSIGQNRRRSPISENHTEHSFTFSTSFMGHMTEEYLHLTVTNGDTKVRLC